MRIARCHQLKIGSNDSFENNLVLKILGAKSAQNEVFQGFKSVHRTFLIFCRLLKQQEDSKQNKIIFWESFS